MRVTPSPASVLERMRALSSLLLSTSALMCGAVACADPHDLGADALDDSDVSAGPAAYLVDALGDDPTLAELLAAGDTLTLDAAPDPTRLLEDTAALDDDRSRRGKAAIRLLAYNVGLLDAQIFGVIDYRATPHLEERRRVLPQLVANEGADVVCLQEVWRTEDVERFSASAAALGYRVFAQDRSGYNDGLMVLVANRAIAGGTFATLAHHAPFTSQDGLEYFPGPSIKRGYVEVAFTHADAGPMRVLCTHMQAFPESWYGRALQARELGVAARTHSTDDELVVVAGDLNAGPYYPRATWTPPEGEEQTMWFHNALSYPLLLAYGGLVDAAVMGRTLEDAASDVVLGDTIVNDPDKALDIPGAQEGWCDETPNTTFTATDCNTLYFDQYAGTEYPARLDHIHVRDREDLVVTGARLVFTEAMMFDDLEVEPSDHYGVEVELLVDRR